MEKKHILLVLACLRHWEKLQQLIFKRQRARALETCKNWLSLQSFFIFLFFFFSWASSKSMILTVGHSSCHCRFDPLSFWQLSTWNSSKRIFQVAIIACHGFINIVHYLLWHGSPGTPVHAKSITEWKTVPILQINANFFLTVLTRCVWWSASRVQNIYQRQKSWLSFPVVFSCYFH